MIEKVNQSHPDKVADRIAGAVVDLAYKKQNNPKVAVEVLIGHGLATVIIESSVRFKKQEIQNIVNRIVGEIKLKLICVAQDTHLANNQNKTIKCGDNGIFKGVPLTTEEKQLSEIAHDIYEEYNCDGKYILANDKLIICQSAKTEDLQKQYKNAIINPLGDWTGGTDVDSGATNRKLGSDMAQSVTGGGLCLSADTEFISDDLCWHRMDSYKDGMKVGQWNNGKLEFVKPLRYIHNQNDYFIEFEKQYKIINEIDTIS